LKNSVSINLPAHVKRRFREVANLLDTKLKLTTEIENLGKLLSNFETKKLPPSISTDRSVRRLPIFNA